MTFSEDIDVEYIESLYEMLNSYDGPLIPGTWSDITISDAKWNGTDGVGFVSFSEVFEYLTNFEYLPESKTPLAHCYCMGFDTITKKLTVVEFKLIPEKINFVGDPNMTHKIAAMNQHLRNAQSQGEVDRLIQQLHNEALIKVRKSVQQKGHIDFRTEALPVTHIFSRDGESRDECKLVPLFNKTIIDFLHFIDQRLLIEGVNLTPSQKAEILSGDKVVPYFEEYLKNHHVTTEHYVVGSPGGAGKYKSTKIFWDPHLFTQYQFSPKVRGHTPDRSSAEKYKSLVRYDGNNKPSRVTKDEQAIVDKVDNLDAKKNDLKAKAERYPYGSKEQRQAVDQYRDTRNEVVKTKLKMIDKMSEPKYKDKK